ncbi:MAG: LytR/AlgR family response regulator transcription factor [Bacteroidota bacterium]
MKLSIAIIDDELLAAKALQEVAQQMPEVENITVYNSTVEALHGLRDRPVDLALMDVELDNANAFQVIQSLPDPPPIIIVSSHDKYAIQAYDYDVIDYIVKPVSIPRLSKAIGRFKKRASPAADNEIDRHIFVRTNGDYSRLRVNDIYWLEGDGENTKVGLADDVLIITSRLKNFEEHLKNSCLIRVHRSFYVNINRIEKFQDDSIFLNDKLIPLSKRYREVFDKAAKFVR